MAAFTSNPGTLTATALHHYRGLNPHRARQREERLAAGSAYTDEGLVFSDRTGKPLHPKVVSNQFRKSVTRHEMPYLSIHGLQGNGRLRGPVGARGVGDAPAG